MTRKKAGILTLAIVALSAPLFFLRCCCSSAVARTAPASDTPSPVGLKTYEPPSGIASHGPSTAMMRNVDFRVTERIILRIRDLKGTMTDFHGGPLNLDDKRTFVVRIADAEVGVDGATLSEVLNNYVFNYPGAPLRNLQISISDGLMDQEGILHKGIDIPFQMKSTVSLTSDGRIRVHPETIKICNLNGKGLMKALGITLEKMIDVSKAKGIAVDKNDLIIEPLTILPPPKIEAKIAAVRLEGDRMIQHMTGDVAGMVDIPERNPGEPNMIVFRGGTLRIGKLFMVEGDLRAIDADPRDPFDFFLDHYNSQLAEGFTRNQVDYGLVVFMRDFSDVGKPLQPGERSAPAPR